MTQCDYCRQPIAKSVHPYTLRLELFPAVEPSLEITAQELKGDFATAMERLIKIMEQMDEGEVIEQEKRVFLTHKFTLCPACRHKLAQRLARLQPPAM
jgi:hypothetical protein